MDFLQARARRAQPLALKMVSTQDCRRAADRNTPLSPRHNISARATLTLIMTALVVGLALVPQVADAASPSVKWRQPVSLENPKKAGSFDAVSCTMETSKPLTGKTTSKKSDQQLCVAADATGHIWWSTMPWKRRAFWKRVTIDKVKGASLTGVSCPNLGLCVVVDNHGDVIFSKDPTGGAKYWSKPQAVDTTAAAGGGPAGFAGISCPSAKLCVAVDNASQVVTSTTPTTGSAWTLAAIAGAPSLTSVSCPSTTLCVLGGSARYDSIVPTGGASSWIARGAIVGGVIDSLACPSLTACVGVGYGDSTTGLASATATPPGPASGWTTTTINISVPSGNSQLLDSVACPTASFCIAVDGADNAFDTVSPLTGGWAAIRSARKLATSTWSAISCDIKNCVVVDSRGFVTSGTVLHASATTSTTTTSTTTTSTTTTPTTTTTTSTSATIK
jgi:hypothetical protein